MQSCPFWLMPIPVRVTGATKQPLWTSVDVSEFAVMDVILSVYEGTDVAVRVITSMQAETEDNWTALEAFATLSAGQSDKKTLSGLLKFARWEVTSSGNATIYLRGIVRVQDYYGDARMLARLSAGTTALTITAGAASTWSTSSGALTVDSAAALDLGPTNATSVNLGRTSITTTIKGTTVSLTGVAGSSYSIGDSGTTGTITVGQSTAPNTINIGNAMAAGGNNQTINIGAGGGRQTITIGSTGADSGGLGASLTLRAGIGNLVVTGAAATNYSIGDSGTTGTITLGQSTDTNTINIGNAATPTGKTQTINIGAGTANNGTLDIHVGDSSAGTNTITIGKYGSNYVVVNLGGDEVNVSKHASSKLGFFTTTAAGKQTVTGSRGGNAALASLLTKLATYGLITDSTTA